MANFGGNFTNGLVFFDLNAIKDFGHPTIAETFKNFKIGTNFLNFFMNKIFSSGILYSILSLWPSFWAPIELPERV